MAEDREDITRSLQAIAVEAFPDNADVRWHLRNIIEAAEFFCVEAEPLPSTVGYPRFRFVVARDASGVFRDHACYCLDRGRWVLLYASPGTADGWRTLGFDRE